MNLIQDKLINFSDSDKLEMIRDYEEFEESGFIGDCLLRKTASVVNPSPQHNVVLWMNAIAHECYRYFANKWLNKTDEGMNLQQKS